MAFSHTAKTPLYKKKKKKLPTSTRATPTPTNEQKFAAHAETKPGESKIEEIKRKLSPSAPTPSGPMDIGKVAEKGALFSPLMSLGAAGIGGTKAAILAEKARSTGIPQKVGKAIPDFIEKSTETFNSFGAGGRGGLMKGISKVGKWITKKPMQAVMVAWFAHEMIQSYGFSGFMRQKAAGDMSFTISSLEKQGLYDDAEELNNARLEVLNDPSTLTIMDQILDKLPGINVIKSAADVLGARRLDAEKKQTVLNIERTAAETGMSIESAYMQDVRISIAKRKQAAIDEEIRADEQRDENIRIYAAAAEIKDAEERKREITARDEDAAFWEAYNIRKLAREKAAADAEAAYYKDIREQLEQNEADRTPSKLGFGLL